MTLAIIAALGSALFVALGSVLQHRAGHAAPTAGLSGVLRSPVWLLGAAAGVTGFCLHVAALSGGSLSVVQPLLVTGLLFALPLSWLLARRPIRALDLGAAGAVVIGLVVFQLTVRTATGAATAGSGTLAYCVAGVLVVSGAGLVLAHRQTRHRASWLGFCAGASYGLLAALIKSSIGTFAAVGIGVLSSWPLYAFAVIVVAAIAVNQLAFNAGPLASSLPLITIVDPVVSIAVGAIAFGETTAVRPALLAGQLIGFVLMTGGVVLLARGQDTA